MNRSANRSTDLRIMQSNGCAGVLAPHRSHLGSWLSSAVFAPKIQKFMRRCLSRLLCALGTATTLFLALVVVIFLGRRLKRRHAVVVLAERVLVPMVSGPCERPARTARGRT